MQDTTEERARFAAAIGKVALLTTKNEKPDKHTLKVYWQALMGLPIETIEAVADDICQNETELISVPPPGRWRQIADSLYVLHPPPAKDVRKARDCPACDDTGWRPVATGVGVVPCECKSGGVPPHGIDLGLLQAPLDVEKQLPGADAELPPVAGESEMERRRREWGNVILTCACCKQPYRRRAGWRCCAPPSGMKYAVWSRQWHQDCEGHGQHRCPNHCQHPTREKVVNFPIPNQGETIQEWAVRTGLREPDAPNEKEESDVGF